MRFAIFEYYAISQRTTATDQHKRGWNEAGWKKGRKEERRRRSSPYMMKSAVIDCK
jgi:hypothetical protein